MLLSPAKNQVILDGHVLQMLLYLFDLLSSTQNETVLKHWSHWCFKFVFCFFHSLCLILVWLKVHHFPEGVSTQDTCWPLLIPLKLLDTTVSNLCQDFGYIWLFLPEACYCLFSGSYFLFPFNFIPLGYFFLISFFCSILFFFCHCYYPLFFSNLCCSIYLAELQGKSKPMLYF